MTRATIGHALCSIGAMLAAPGIHSQFVLPEWMPLKWIRLSQSFGFGFLIFGVALKGLGHIILLVDSIFTAKPERPNLLDW